MLVRELRMMKKIEEVKKVQQVVVDPIDCLTSLVWVMKLVCKKFPVSFTKRVVSIVLV